MAGFSSHRELYEQILVLTSQQDVDAQALYILLERHKDTFLTLFAKKVCTGNARRHRHISSPLDLFLKDLWPVQAPDAATRQQVQSCRVTLTSGEEIALDPEPDVRMVRLLLDCCDCTHPLSAPQESQGCLAMLSCCLRWTYV
jgi:hypothetical protein